jgi:hypothetical protein
MIIDTSSPITASVRISPVQAALPTSLIPPFGGADPRKTMTWERRALDRLSRFEAIPWRQIGRMPLALDSG